MNNHNHNTHTGDDTLTPGYYLLTIGSSGGEKLLKSNDERAFVVTQLQDSLSSWSVLESPQPHKQLAAHIDLLAFSIQPQDIRLLLFAISRTSVHILSHTIIEHLLEYQTEYRIIRAPIIEPTSIISRIVGPHRALAVSVDLHLRHTDWEYDRYSSIGFYLHDRRGSWMRPWRISRLFNAQPDTYRLLLQAATSRAKHSIEQNTPSPRQNLKHPKGLPEKPPRE